MKNNMNKRFCAVYSSSQDVIIGVFDTKKHAQKFIEDHKKRFNCKGLYFIRDRKDAERFCPVCECDINHPQARGSWRVIDNCACYVMNSMCNDCMDELRR